MGPIPLYPVYIRGMAYFAANQGGQAIGEFQKIFDHRAMVLNSPIGVLAHLPIGRAYAMQGDTTRAKSAYKDFLTLWIDHHYPLIVAAATTGASSRPSSPRLPFLGWFALGRFVLR
jgi:hypothetical protein